MLFFGLFALHSWEEFYVNGRNLEIRLFEIEIEIETQIEVEVEILNS